MSARSALGACGYLAAWARSTARSEVLCAVVCPLRDRKGGNSAVKEPRLLPGFVLPHVGLVENGIEQNMTGLCAGNPKYNTIQWIIWLGGR